MKNFVNNSTFSFGMVTKPSSIISEGKEDLKKFGVIIFSDEPKDLLSYIQERTDMIVEFLFRWRKSVHVIPLEH